MTSRQKNVLRGSLAVATAVGTAAALFFAQRAYRAVPPLSGVDLLDYNDQMAKAFDLALDSSENLRQLGLLMLGALWALIIAKRDEIHIGLSDTAELTMFGCANMLVGLSLFCQWRYAGALEEFLLYSASDGAQIPDFTIPQVTTFVTLQFVFLLCGGAATAVALFSTARLKK